MGDHGYILTPGRYVGARQVEQKDEPFEENMKRLTAMLAEQSAESGKPEQVISKNLKGLEYGP